MGRSGAAPLRGETPSSRSSAAGSATTKAGMMAGKVKWGILSAANIAKKRVIPAMKECALAEIAAIGSRSLEKAVAVAAEFAIPKVYGSYEELLGDPEIDVI